MYIFDRSSTVFRPVIRASFVRSRAYTVYLAHVIIVIIRAITTVVV